MRMCAYASIFVCVYVRYCVGHVSHMNESNMKSSIMDESSYMNESSHKNESSHMNESCPTYE